ncbi:MAG: hypothetical protein GF309_06605 [Candidatus Lokiarchaeota archaeon]|nr:hypothetical protein [Candidatus Lokiarchaeota archaeon]
MRNKKVRICIMISVLMMISFAAMVDASYSISEDDTSGYSSVRIDDPYLSFTVVEADKDDGQIKVGGDHNTPWGPDYCKVDMKMEFTAQEDGSISMQADWSLSWKLETDYQVGDAKLYIRYVLWSDSSDIENEVVFYRHVYTPLWGGYESSHGIENEDDTVSFSSNLSEGTEYAVSVQLHIRLDGEANAWSYSGATNPVSLDVNEITVWN